MATLLLNVAFSIGASLIARALAPDQEVGKLDNLKLQSSQYGDMLPILYGRKRFGGTVIWKTDLQPHRSSSSGGKGGPTVTTFTYSASFAIGICDRDGSGPILDIPKAWANGRTIWDADGTDSTMACPFTIYYGSDSQTADPTMEAELGVGNVPGYRHTALVVFDEFFLTDYGNVIPSFNFEVITDGGPIPTRISSADIVDPLDNGSRMNVVLVGTTGQPTTDLLGDDLPTGTIISTIYDIFGDTYTERYTDKLTGASVRADQTISCPINALRGAVQNALWACIDNGSIGVWCYRGAPVVFPITELYHYASGHGIQVGNYFFFTLTGSTGVLARWPLSDTGAPLAFLPDLSVALGAESVVETECDDNQERVLVRHDPDLIEFDLDLNEVNRWRLASPTPGAFGGVYKFRDFFAFSTTTGIGGEQILLFNVSGTYPANVWTARPNTITPFSYASSRLIPLAPGSGNVVGRDGVVSLFGNIGSITLADIVSDVSVRCGRTLDEIDVTDIPDPVDGYAISSQMSGRDGLQPLRDAFFFDGVERDGKIIFLHRGKSSVVTFEDGDIAARSDNDEPPVPLGTVRAQEEDIPSFITVGYLNLGADYQDGLQQSQRQTTRSQQTKEFKFDIVMTDKKGKSIADTQLAEFWAEREKKSWTSSLKYSRYEPTDVCTVHDQKIRITSKKESPKGVIEWEGYPNIVPIYTGASVASDSKGFAVPPTTSALATTLLLLDIPLITDSEAQNGFTAAMAPATTGTWTGSTLQKSSDSGTTYAEAASSSTANIFGAATDVLGDFAGGNVFDETNVGNVAVNGELSGATSAAVLNGANEWLWGNEVLQSKNAVLTGVDVAGNNIYALSGHLRGRRGTEWAMSNHQVGDRFVVLPALDVDAPLGDLMRERQYKAVTFGKTLSSATAVAFTNSGSRLRPLSPVHLGGGIDGSGNATLTWIRRTRVGGNWVDFTDVLLSETTEKYEVQIWDAGYSLCARIIETTTQTASYSAADQVTDFGALQATIYFTVGQVGSLGLGRNAQGSIAGGGGSDNAPLSPITPYNNPVVPAPTPGTCTPVGAVINTTLSWTTPIRVYSGAFTTDDVWVLQFTTGASVAGSGLFAAAEYGGGPITRTAEIALSPCGTALASTSGTTISFNLSGTAGSGLVQVLPSTTYYVAIETASNGQMFADLTPNH